MATDDNIQTNWTADFSGINSALNEVKDSSDDAFSKMIEGALEASEKVAESQQHVAEEVHEAAEHIHEEGINIGETLEGIKRDFDALKEITGFAFVYEYVERLVEKIGELTERADHMEDMASIARITTDQYQALSAAAEETGVSMGVVDRAVDRLVLMLQQARNGAAEAQDKLHLLGITNEQITSTSFGTAEALEAIHRRMEETETSTEETNAILEVFGIRGALAAEVFKEFDGSVAGVSEKMRAVNGLSEEQISDLKKMHAEYERLETQMTNFWEKTLLFIAKGLQGLDDFRKDIGELDLAHLTQDDESEADKKAGVGGGGEGSGKTDTAFAARMAEEEAAKEAAAGRDAARLQTSMTEKERAAAADASREVVAAAQHEVAEALKEAADEKGGDVRKALSAQELASEAAGLAEFKAGTEARLSALRKYAADVAATYTGNVAAVRAANTQVLAAERELQEERKRFFESTEEQMLNIQQQINNGRLQSDIDFTTESKRELQNAVNDIDEATGLLEESSRNQLEQRLNDLSLETTAVKAAYAANELSARQAYSKEIALANEKLAAEQRNAAALKALAGDDLKAQNAAAQAGIKAENNYKQAVLRSRQELAKRIEQEWSTLTNALRSSLSSSLSGMLEGTMTFADGMRNILGSVIDALIQMFVDWAVKAIEQFFIVKAVQGVTASEQVASNAAVAATAAMGSVAAIPIYGWAMAPEVGAATLAEALSYEALASAAGGYEVPHDMIAQVHKDEKILPARFNDGLTNLVNSYSSGGDNSPNARSKPAKGFSINAQAVSDQHMLVKRGDLVALIQEANNRNQFRGRR